MEWEVNEMTRTVEEKKAKAAERQRRYVANHPERAAESVRRYREKYPERAVEYKRKYNEEHTKEHVEYNRRWNAEHPDEFKIICARRNHKRRAREEVTTADLTAAQWKIIIEQQGNRCAHCGCEFTADTMATKDHIIPVSKGGDLTFTNVQALCLPCNARKRDRLESELEYLKR
jgi:5-methylcytosine-specific restriction endonuclease McrA